MKGSLSPFTALLFLISLLYLAKSSSAQFEDPPEDHSYKPLTVKLSDDGKKYLRFILWNQLWLSTNNLEGGENLLLTPSIRRARVLAYSQISPRFLILTHFGLNNLGPNNLTALGNDGDGAQLFLHGAWGELRVCDGLYLGTGLHYWKGLTRLANASTLNFMTLDQIRPWAHWHSLGISDQFARHLGVYAKGQIGGFDYRVAANAPGRNPLGEGKDYGLKDSPYMYTGVSNPDGDGNPVGNYIFEGYFRYNFWDKESIKLPYAVGSYLGNKKVLGLGAGFFIHPNAMYDTTNLRHEDVAHFATDLFLEYPLSQGDMVHFYGSFINFDYGMNYVSRWAGTGSQLYGQLGYYIQGLKLMPYVALQNGSYDGFDDPISSLDIGLNYHLNGHNCKITLEYHMISADVREAAIATPADALSQLRMQLHVFL